MGAPSRRTRGEETAKNSGDARISDAKRQPQPAFPAPAEHLIPAPVPATPSTDPKVLPQEAEPPIPAPGSGMSVLPSLDTSSRDPKVLQREVQPLIPAHGLSASRSRDPKVPPQEAGFSASLLRVTMVGNLKKKSHPDVPSSSNSKMGRLGDCSSPQKIFHGFRFVLLGDAKTPELYESITSRGGQILPASQFGDCTHLCVHGHVAGIEFSGLNVVSKYWIMKCCKANRLEGIEDDCLNELCKLHHQLFLCPLDQGKDLVNLTMALEGRNKTDFVITPGSSNHESLVTDDWIKLLVKKSYVLVRRFHLAGLTLNGKFDAANLIVDKSLGKMCVKFAYLDQEAVTKATPQGKILDLEKFIQVVRHTIFGDRIPGHDLNSWLSMLKDAEIQDMMVGSVLLMDLQACSEKFNTLYDELLNSNCTIKEYVATYLAEYNGWQKVVESSEGNGYVEVTYNHVEDRKFGKDRYSDTVFELLRLLRNCRQHKALARSSLFALVIGQHFPNLLSDLQRALFLARKAALK